MGIAYAAPTAVIVGVFFLVPLAARRSGCR